MNLGVVLIVVNSMVVALSSACFKLGAGQLHFRQPRTILTNKWVLLGIGLGPCTFILNVNAYRYGDISLLHPLLQLSLVWSVLLGVVLFKESISLKTGLGILLVLLGAILISLGAG